MILVKQSVSVADKYGLKVCLFDDVKQQAIAYFYDEGMAQVAAEGLNAVPWLFHDSLSKFESNPVPSYRFGFTK
jgi:hypothetical protein